MQPHGRSTSIPAPPRCVGPDRTAAGIARASRESPHGPWTTTPSLNTLQSLPVGPVAQRSEQRTHNPSVGGSNPPRPIRKPCCRAILPGSGSQAQNFVPNLSRNVSVSVDPSTACGRMPARRLLRSTPKERRGLGCVVAGLRVGARRPSQRAQRLRWATCCARARRPPSSPALSGRRLASRRRAVATDSSARMSNSSSCS
jgi:hypothetical protein